MSDPFFDIVTCLEGPPTREVYDWLRNAEVAIQTEAELRIRNLLLYGCSHPEAYR